MSSKHNPATSSNCPTTAFSRQFLESRIEQQRHREQLTVEFPRVVVEGLAEGAAADGARRQEALLLGHVVVVHEHAGDGRGDDGDDDGEAAESPAEGAVLVEELGDGGAGEDVGDEGRRIQPVENHTVTQRSHVGQEDVDDVAHAVVADPVEDLPFFSGEFVVFR